MDHDIIDEEHDNAWFMAPAGVSNALRPIPTPVEMDSLQGIVVSRMALRMIVEDEQIQLPGFF